MPRGEKPDRSLRTVRILALLAAALAVMCVGLAVAWKQQRDSAECWRTAAQYQLPLTDECGS
jgi:hypothetical protein